MENTRRVLVVDDDAADRKNIKRMISRSGMPAHVSEADCADVALDLADTGFDAVFLDYLLAGESGLKLIGKFRKACPRAAIVLLTGHGGEDIAKTAIQQGATDYFAKNALNQSQIEYCLRTGVSRAQQEWRLDQQRRDMATFIDVLVHDFKAPVRATTYLSEQIANGIENGDTGEVAELSKLLIRKSAHMMDILASLSAHVRFDYQQNYGEADILEVIAKALDLLCVDIETAGASVAVEVAGSMPPVRCDPAQISQLLLNLVANALKFTRNRAPDIRIRVAKTDLGFAMTEIVDNGPGIPAQYIEKIFEPFKRLPAAGAVEGTGLGLATCKKIVERHNGRIWCNSTLGEGTTMTFSLPLVK